MAENFLSLDFGARNPALAWLTKDGAAAAEQAGRLAEADALWEFAFSLSLGAESDIPTLVKMVRAEEFPSFITSANHAIARISASAITVYCLPDIKKGPICSLQRMGVVGRFLHDAARTLAPGQQLGCVVDFADGCDLEGDYPRIAFSAARENAILVPDPYFFNSNNYEALRRFCRQLAPPWHRRQQRVFWRGTANGQWRESASGGPFDWRWHQRFNLCHTARNSAHGETIDIALVTELAHDPAELQRLITALGLQRERADFVKPAVQKHEFLAYRYLIDIDGWSNSWSLLEKMLMGATILKVESAFGFRQWYYDRLVPWQHYIPIRADLADFDEKIAWALAVPEESERIARNAAELAGQMDLAAEMAAAHHRIMPIMNRITPGVPSSPELGAE